LYERPGTEFVAGFMGEAMLFDGEARAGAVGVGRVKVAVRPEAWEVRPAGAGALAATVAKVAYLGSLHEYTFETELGPIFVTSPDLQRVWRRGESASLALAGHGLSVVAL
jgi:iron(III) transport system ATP-binding protein